jgi:hypothetical protein
MLLNALLFMCEDTDIRISENKIYGGYMETKARWQKATRALIHEARICIKRADYLETQSEENPIYLKFAVIQHALARDMLGDASSFLEIKKPEFARILRKESYTHGYKSLYCYERTRFTTTPEEIRAALEKLKRENHKLFSQF